MQTRPFFLFNSVSPLRSLAWLRWFGLVAQASVIALSEWVFAVALPLTALLTILVFVARINLFASWRAYRAHTVSSIEISIWLSLDLLALTAMLYFTGGATNPFVSLYLLPVALAVVILPALAAWAVAGLAALGYSVLMIWHVPMHAMHHNFDLHVYGMWANFLITAMLLLVFITLLVRALRQREQQLATAREQALRDAQIVAIGNLAAGTAHELNTPFSTINLLIDDLSENLSNDQNAHDNLQLMQQQIQRCQTHVEQLFSRANPTTSQHMAASDFFAQQANDWAVTRSDINLKINNHLPDNLPLHTQPQLGQAITNLLNNAADAGLEQQQPNVLMSVYVQHENLHIEIDDNGPGIANNIRPQLGKTPISSKGAGRGLGVLLATTTIEQLGGQLHFIDTNNGTRSQIIIPLVRLQ